MLVCFHACWFERLKHCSTSFSCLMIVRLFISRSVLRFQLLTVSLLLGVDNTLITVAQEFLCLIQRNRWHNTSLTRTYILPWTLPLEPPYSQEHIPLIFRVVITLSLTFSCPEGRKITSLAELYSFTYVTSYDSQLEFQCFVYPHVERISWTLMFLVC